MYHVTSRGNGRATIFHDDADCERFLSQLAHHLRLADVQLFAYVLMGNHFYLLVRTPRANLSRFMQRLLSSYALYSRYKHRRPGHVFQGRFKAKLIEDESYLLAVSRYIHLNPVKTAAVRRWSAGQRLRHLENYRWSSYPGHVAKINTQEFMRYEVLKEFGRDEAAARRHYRVFVCACLTEDDGPLLDALAANRYAIGSETFMEETEGRIERRRSGGARDKDLDLPRRAVSLDDIDAKVERHFKIDRAQLVAAWTPRRRGESGGRGTGRAAGRSQRPRGRRALRYQFHGRRSRTSAHGRPAGGAGNRRPTCNIAPEAPPKVESLGLTPIRRTMEDPDGPAWAAFTTGPAACWLRLRARPTSGTFATVQWETTDGVTHETTAVTTPIGGAGQWGIFGGYTYLTTGLKHAVVTLTASGTALPQVTVPITVSDTIAVTPLPVDIDALNGGGYVEVATFADTDPAAVSADYTASVSGLGTSSNATVVPDGNGGFDVYAQLRPTDVHRLDGGDYHDGYAHGRRFQRHGDCDELAALGRRRIRHVDRLAQ